MKKKNVVVMGGGHGQAAVLRGLKLCDDINLTAIVTVADDGGSTGRLRKEFHIPAMGDIRGVMIALADEENLLRQLMDYRFADDDDEPNSLGGHNLGNIILTALTQQTGSFMKAVTQVSHVLNVHGDIVPSTTEVISLYAVMEDGTIVKGESNIPRVRNKITRVYYDHNVKATKAALQAIKDADYIVYGVGSLYTSILPNLIIKDIQKAIKNSSAKKIYFCNSMTQAGETEGYSVEDHVNAILDEVPVDTVYYACDKIPEKILARYRKEEAYPVKVSMKKHPYVLKRRSLLNFENGQVRHDATKLSKVFEQEISK